MARKHPSHDDHLNHEAWVIPYADLLTLLLAFFVVMYALSSLNEGKYKEMATSMSSAFGGPPTSVTPIQLGKTQVRGSDYDRPSAVQAASAASPTISPTLIRALDRPLIAPQGQMGEIAKRRAKQLHALSDRIQHALSELVAKDLVRVRYNSTYIEIEIQSDILFASGSATPSPVAISTARKIGEILRDEPNAVRVEGHTDNVPIQTAQFPSNWELSSARAAGIVHQLIGTGVKADRLAISGFGEYQPVATNDTTDGRNANRRVMMVILTESHGEAVVEAQALANSSSSAPAGSADDAGEADSKAQAQNATTASAQDTSDDINAG